MDFLALKEDSLSVSLTEKLKPKTLLYWIRKHTSLQQQLERADILEGMSSYSIYNMPGKVFSSITKFLDSSYWGMMSILCHTHVSPTSLLLNTSTPNICHLPGGIPIVKTEGSLPLIWCEITGAALWSGKKASGSNSDPLQCSITKHC